MKTEKNLLNLIFAFILLFTVSCAGITDANLTEVEDTERIRIESADLQAQDENIENNESDPPSVDPDREQLIRIRPE